MSPSNEAAEAAQTICAEVSNQTGRALKPDGEAWVASIIDRASAPALRDALKEAIEIIEDLYKWEPITAGETEDGPETYKGWRGNMPAGLVEMSNAAGVPPEEMNPKLERLKAALTAAGQES